MTRVIAVGKMSVRASNIDLQLHMVDHDTHLTRVNEIRSLIRKVHTYLGLVKV